MALFDLDPLLNAMLDTAPGISDLNLSVGRPPQVEIDGALHAVPYAGIQRLMPYHTELIALRLGLRGPRCGGCRLLHRSRRQRRLHVLFQDAPAGAGTRHSR